MLAAALLLAFVPPQEPAAATLQAELARLVDLPSERARRLAAEQLAQKNVAALEPWRAACAAFGEFEPLESGAQREEADLMVLGEVEHTELHLYVPPGYDPAQPAPLLLWGHGAGGSGARQWRPWQEIADAAGMLVLAPTEFGKVAGWGFTPRERAAQLAALRWVRRRANIDENAIFLGGASRGGHMTWDLALRGADLWAGLVPCIGGPRLQIGPQNNMRYLANVAQLPIRGLQGSKDDPLLLANLHLAFERLQRLKAPDVELREFADLGHAYSLEGLDWAAFFAKRRTAVPARVVLRAADLAEARSTWLRITAFERNVAVDAAPRVSQAHWNALDDAGQRKLLLDAYDDLTAELEVKDRGSGRFAARGSGVRGFELLLTPEQLGRRGAIEVRWGSRTVRATAEPSVATLLTEFAERFDRTFLPVTTVSIR
ncbi:MAG: hypothetical protein KDE27_21485 [Planctomycetes bacterium]|nr:hypothetical protein [Planctomycetota bacterium]